jgi:hypothetical protein
MMIIIVGYDITAYRGLGRCTPTINLKLQDKVATYATILCWSPRKVMR